MIRLFLKIGNSILPFIFKTNLFGLLLITLIYSCNNSQEEEALRHDYYPSKTSLKFASNFSVEYFKSYKIVDVFEAGDRTQAVQRYYLVEHGTKVPDMDEGATMIRVPLSSVSCFSTPQLSYLSKLKQTDKISGVGHASSIRIPEIREQLEKGWTMEITRSGSLDKELLLQSNTTILMANAFDKAMLDELNTLGIPLIFSTEYSENSVLARAEWIKFFALFFNKENEAELIFEEILTQYSETKKLLSEQRKDLNVMFGSYYQGSWFVPGGNSLISSLLHDAGVHYVFQERMSNGNLQMDNESMIATLNKIDHWGMVLSKNEKVELNDFFGGDPRLEELAKENNIQLFYSNSNESDYFGMAYLDAHVLLKDLAKIFHPELFSEHQFVYFQALK